MIHIYMFTACMALSLTSCNDDSIALGERDWNTASYFKSTDEKGMTTFYKPSAGYVGDPMPFYDPVAKNFKVMYLQEFRPNASGTYHPIWAVETTDAANYTAMGELIATGGLEEQDAAIGTGSTIYNESERLYYTFYTGNKYHPKANDAAQAVMYATSSDFKTWTKSKTFLLKGGDYGYSNNDFRDPFVFKGDDGNYHLIVATTQNNKGKLVEFISSDLKTWKHVGEFMNMMWDRFYECPDVFKMGDWWYLIYSEKHVALRKVQYFKGKTLEELKASTANDAGIWPDAHEGFLDSRGFYAGKTASDGTNRYIWGWCPTRAGNDNTAVGAAPNEPEWGGNLVAHRIIQHADGTLTLGEVPAMAAKYNKKQTLTVMDKSGEGVEKTGENYSLSGNSYILFNRLGYHNKISFTVKTNENGDKFGVSLGRGTDSEKYYTMVFNPENENNRKVNFEEEGKMGKGFVAGIDGYVFARPADNTYDVRIYTDNSVCVVYINDVCCYTNRVYGIQKNCWSINNYGGKISISNLEVSNY